MSSIETLKRFPKWHRPNTEGCSPQSVCAHSSTLYDNKLHVFGGIDFCCFLHLPYSFIFMTGWNGNRILNDIYILDCGLYLTYLIAFNLN